MLSHIATHHSESGCNAGLCLYILNQTELNETPLSIDKICETDINEKK